MKIERKFHIGMEHSANYTDVNSNNTEIIPIVTGPLTWKTWSEPTVSDLPVICLAKTS